MYKINIIDIFYMMRVLRRMVACMDVVSTLEEEIGK
jgi:hypothetical protein